MGLLYTLTSWPWIAMVICHWNLYILRCSCLLKTSNKLQAWCPLGYIPNIGLMSKAKSQHSMTSSQKVKFYHDILGHILVPLIQLQQSDAMLFPLLYHGTQYHLKLKFPLLAVLGDTKSHDRLCGRYNM
jgi:hypothetical protein